MILCDLDGGDLIAYLDGELAGARLEYIEAHVRACTICQDRLRDIDETKELLRLATPIVDDPVGRARTMAMIAQEARRPRLSSWRPPLSVVVIAVTLILVLVTWPTIPSQAGFQLAALVNRVQPHLPRAQDPSTVLERSRLPGMALASPAVDQPGTAASFAVVVVPRLPGSLTLTSFVQAQPDLADLRYLGPHDLRLQVLESPSSTASSTVSPSYQRVVISNTDVLWHTDPQTPDITRAIWIRHGVQFELSVETSSGPGLSPSAARQIVAQIIVAQDRADA